MSNKGKGGVSSCYVFKSRLQEYAQKGGFSTPHYETIKEGPSHEPLFRSTVILNNNRYDSLPRFSNRRAAEQSAAEIALIELAKSSGDKKDCISQPVHVLGLCKNLLQEYAQKKNYAMPRYECKNEGTTNSGPFSCCVEIGGIRYIGAVAKTKKEAEIKAARTALLAIQTSSPEMGDDLNEGTNYTVLPPERKEPPPKVVKKRKTNSYWKKFGNKKLKVDKDNATATATQLASMHGVSQTNSYRKRFGNKKLKVDKDNATASATQLASMPQEAR